jgi:hypothetical protein
MTHEDDLRSWAKGTYTYEAATELLLRAFGGRFAGAGRPWIRFDGDTGKPWIDFAVIPVFVEGISGGERGFLMLAASLAENVPVVLGDVVSGLDRGNLELVLAALAHAGGSHEHSDFLAGGDGMMLLYGKLESLHPWPRTLRSG